jgi:hypothetical protein
MQSTLADLLSGLGQGGMAPCPKIAQLSIRQCIASKKSHILISSLAKSVKICEICGVFAFFPELLAGF